MDTKLVNQKPSLHANSPKKPQFSADQKVKEYNDLNSLPPGYRFRPHDVELIVEYLIKKLMNKTLPPNKIHEINLSLYNPSQLADMFIGYGEKEIYIFTPRNRKYRNGSRPNRAAGDGYWKATGADKSIRFNGQIVGFKKSLVFYEGKPPKGDKTNWIMHEYRAIGSHSPLPKERVTNDMKLDDWVLCKIYKKAKSLKSQVTEETNELTSMDCEGSDAVSNIDFMLNITDQFQLDATLDVMDMDIGSNYLMDNPYPVWSTYSDNFGYESQQFDSMNQYDSAFTLNDPSDSFPK